MYLSYFFKRNRQEYYDLLNRVRNNDDFEGWIKFFIEGVFEVSEQAAQTAQKIMTLQQADNERLFRARIASPQAVVLLDKLFSFPIVTVPDVKRMLNTSYMTANTLVSKLERTGILKEGTGRRRNRIYAYTQFLDIIAEGTNV